MKSFNKQIFHLWGAKDFYEKENVMKSGMIKKSVIIR